MLAIGSALLALVMPLSVQSSDWGVLATDNSAQGSYSQWVFNEDGSRLSETVGVFRVHRPSYIDWRVIRPEQQRYLLNDEAFWQQDDELAIVIKRDRIDAAQTPLRFIWGNVDQLSGAELVERTDNRLVVVTKVGNVSQRVTAVWEDDSTLVVSTTDDFGQRTVITLIIERKNELQPSDFEYDQPASLELYDETTSSREYPAVGADA